MKEYNITKVAPVDFSKGIRSDEIKDNFDNLQDQLNNERKIVGGSGIAYGLDMSINSLNDFFVDISKGVLVDDNGNEISVNDITTIQIQRPRLNSVSETCPVVLDTLYDSLNQPYDVGKVLLKYEPYAETRDTTLENKSLIEYTNITMKISGSYNSFQVPLKYSSKINGTTESYNLYIDKSLVGKSLDIEYQYAQKRYDLIYIKNINDAYSIQIVEGTSSRSPSMPVEPIDCAYIIGYILIDPCYKVSGVKQAKVIFTDNTVYRRNLYTSGDDNTLYICGIPFKDLQIIHMEEPIDPEVNTLWYDINNNVLNIWKTLNGISGWVGMGDTSFTKVQESKIWRPGELDYPVDNQTFIFNEEETNLNFIPGTHALEIIIGQMPLYSDQYDEHVNPDIDITKTPFVNTGDGFVLKEALDRADYVEVKVTHYISRPDLPKRFQKTTEFVTNDSITCVSSLDNVVITSKPYRVGENQLEVYVDGKRISKAFIQEGTDILDTIGGPITTGTLSNKFKVLSSVNEGTVIDYKITSTVFTYDALDQEFVETAIKNISHNKGYFNSLIELNATYSDISKNYLGDYAMITTNNITNIWVWNNENLEWFNTNKLADFSQSLSDFITKQNIDAIPESITLSNSAMQKVEHDNSLSGDGIDDSLLKINLDNIISDTTYTGPEDEWIHNISNVGPIFTNDIISALPTGHPIENKTATTSESLLAYDGASNGGYYYNKSGTFGSITSCSYSGGLVNVFSPLHGLSTSVSVPITFTGDCGIFGTQTITVTGISNFTFPYASNPGSLSGNWHTDKFVLYSTVSRIENTIIFGISGNGSIATATCSAHNLPLNSTITGIRISGSANYDGVYTITTDYNTSTFKFSHTSNLTNNTGTLRFTSIITPILNTTFSLRSAGVSAIDISVPENCTILSELQVAKISLSPTVVQYIPNNINTNIIYGNTGISNGTNYVNSNFCTAATFINKYGIYYDKITIAKIKENKYNLDIKVSGATTENKSIIVGSVTINCSPTLNIKTVNKLTTFRIVLTNAVIRNGSSIIIKGL